MNELFDLPGPDFLALFAVMAVAGGCAALVASVLAVPAGSERWAPDDPYDLAVVRGGARGLFEATLARLLQLRYLSLDAVRYPPVIRVENAPRGALRAVEQTLFDAAKDDGVTLADAQKLVEPEAARRLDVLADVGAASSRERHAVTIAITLAPLVIVLVIGLTKMALGLERHRPVTWLFLLNLAVGAAGWFLAKRASRATRAARAVVAAEREKNAGLRDSMGTTDIEQWSAGDVALSVALFGVAPLVTSPLAALPTAFTLTAPSDGGGGSSCGSSCGGGCGGGCGGCGS